MSKRSAALRAPRERASERVQTPEGATATVQAHCIVVKNEQGAIVVVYDAQAHTATISVPDGDLNLCAPKGKVVLEAGTDLEMRATGKASMRSAQAEVITGRASVRAAAADLVASTVEAATATLSWRVGRWELGAERVFERAVDVYRDVQELLQSKAGRIRTVVRESTSVMSGSTNIVSKEDTFVDGRRVLLG